MLLSATARLPERHTAATCVLPCAPRGATNTHTGCSVPHPTQPPPLTRIHTTHARRYIADTLGEGAFAVGEYFPSLSWSGGHLEYEQDAARRLLCDWAAESKHCSVFDFVLKGQLQEAVKNNQYGERLFYFQREGRGAASRLLLLLLRGLLLLDSARALGSPQRCAWPGTSLGASLPGRPPWPCAPAPRHPPPTALAPASAGRLCDRDGKPCGVNGWAPTKAITFVENHDTGSTQQHWPFPGDRLGEGYAYILTHPGVPCIFVEDWQRQELRALITDLVRLHPSITGAQPHHTGRLSCA